MSSVLQFGSKASWALDLGGCSEIRPPATDSIRFLPGAPPALRGWGRVGVLGAAVLLTPNLLTLAYGPLFKLFDFLVSFGKDCSFGGSYRELCRNEEINNQ